MTYLHARCSAAQESLRLSRLDGQYIWLLGRGVFRREGKNL